jgi:hypothetical protein
MEGRRRHPVLAAEIRDRRPGLVLPQHPMICPSVTLFRFIPVPLLWSGFQQLVDEKQGVASQGAGLCVGAVGRLV